MVEFTETSIMRIQGRHESPFCEDGRGCVREVSPRSSIMFKTKELDLRTVSSSVFTHLANHLDFKDETTKSLLSRGFDPSMTSRSIPNAGWVRISSSSRLTRHG